MRKRGLDEVDILGHGLRNEGPMKSKIEVCKPVLASPQ